MMQGTLPLPEHMFAKELLRRFDDIGTRLNDAMMEADAQGERIAAILKMLDNPPDDDSDTEDDDYDEDEDEDDGQTVWVDDDTASGSNGAEEEEIRLYDDNDSGFAEEEETPSPMFERNIHDPEDLPHTENLARSSGSDSMLVTEDPHEDDDEPKAGDKRKSEDTFVDKANGADFDDEPAEKEAKTHEAEARSRPARGRRPHSHDFQYR